jgi:hypothetical protein
MQEVTLDVPFLRTRAMQCRELAAVVRNQQIRERLRLIARDDYETMASNLNGPNKVPWKPTPFAERIRGSSRRT